MIKVYITNCVNTKSRQVPFFLYWPVENVQFGVNSISHFGWVSSISNFPRFQTNVSSLELLKYISENSSPKGSFWCNKRKTEFSELSLDSPYLLSMALKLVKINRGKKKKLTGSKEMWHVRFCLPLMEGQSKEVIPFRSVHLSVLWLLVGNQFLSLPWELFCQCNENRFCCWSLKRSEFCS